ncbi:hypothetical protein A1D22_04050 [Pasteurellaceae bacterium LFhippo2]|nr:hypothetical protein [Pasteurellaceae bacterium LFhippo2]
MKNLAKLSLTVLASALLVACGSGGSNGGSPATQPSATNTPINNTATNNTATATNSSSTTKVDSAATGAVYIIPDDGYAVDKKVLTNSTISSITVDGIAIPVSQSNSLMGRRIGENELYTTTYSNMSFGAYEVDDRNDANDKTYFFYNGTPTAVADMPSGTATYKGEALLDGDTVRGRDIDYAVGTSEFTANFGSKTLTGTVSAAGVNVAVNANIDSNGFTGTASSTDYRGSANVEGKFYGAKAQEMGGMFMQNNREWGGAFGAKKQ